MKFNKELLQVLCPYGEWQHTKGMQVVDEESARRMKRSAIWSPMTQIPIYIGHPDDIPSKRKPKAVGQIKRICRTHDGIAVVATYSEQIYADVVSGKFSAMSPRWQMEHIDGEKYRPIKLISVGLTNNPNISGSGKILSMRDDKKLLASTISQTQKISKQIGKIGKRIASITQKTKSLKVELASKNLSKRLEGRQSLSQPKTIPERKMSVSKLVDAALSRSRALGEPYTKSFATIKKQNI